MNARFALYPARDPDTAALGWAGFVESSAFLGCVGWRPSVELARVALCGVMRRHGVVSAQSDDGEIIRA